MDEQNGRKPGRKSLGVSQRESAKILRLSQSTIHRMVKAGALRRLPDGSICRDSLDAFVNHNGHQNPDPEDPDTGSTVVPLDLYRERLRRVLAEADRIEVQVAKSRAEHLDRERCLASVRASTVDLVAIVMNLRAAITDGLAALPDWSEPAIRVFLRHVVWEHLNDAADHFLLDVPEPSPHRPQKRGRDDGLTYEQALARLEHVRANREEVRHAIAAGDVVPYDDVFGQCYARATLLACALQDACEALSGELSRDGRGTAGVSVRKRFDEIVTFLHQEGDRIASTLRGRTDGITA